MRNTRNMLRFGALFCAILAGLASAQAQQGQGQGTGSSAGQGTSQGGATQPQAPIPAVHSPLASLSNGGQDDTENQPVTPDTHSLSGAQYLGVGGGAAYSHSFWQPSVDVSFVGLSNPVIGGSGGGWNTYTSVTGAIDLHKISGISSFTMSAQAGASFSNGGGSTSNVEQLAFTEALSFRRWTLTLIDQVGYLPQASFGYSSLGTSGGGQNSIASTSGLQTGFVPNQSILTAPGQRISNAGIAQVNYLISPRSSLTLVGSDGILHYFANDLNDTSEVTGQVGYNYDWTRRDTIAVLYTFDGFRYNNINQSINSHSAQLSYARRVTGRLSFQLSGGPEIAFSNLPLTNQTGSTVIAPTGQTTEFLWTATSAITYNLRRTSLQASYSHGVTGGSGVLAGAVSDSATGTLSRQMSRVTGVNLTGGYSRNKGLSITPGTTAATASSQTFDYWFGGASLTHTMGRSFNVALGYQLQYQTSNQTFCVVAPCATSFTVHEVSLDFSFRPPLIPF